MNLTDWNSVAIFITYTVICIHVYGYISDNNYNHVYHVACISLRCHLIHAEFTVGHFFVLDQLE